MGKKGKLSVFRNNKTASAISLVIALTVTALLIYTPTIRAATVETQVVYYNLPTSSGVGQPRSIQIQISPNPPSGYLYQNCQLTIDKPDGSSSILDVTSNETGYTLFYYTPDTIGTYRIVSFYYPGLNTSTDYYTGLNALISHDWDVWEEPDVYPPTGSVVINNNETITDSVSVTLTLSANDSIYYEHRGVSAMRFSNDGTSWSNWEAYTIFTPSPVYITSKAWTLTSGDGTKTVYVQFRDEAGLTSASYSDTIILRSRQVNSSISCSLSATTLTFGETVTISGYLSPSLGGANILIQGRIKGDTWITLATVSTESDSRYSFFWSPSTTGTWEVKASWGGDPDILPCESPIRNIKVEPIESSLSISLSELIVTVEEDLTISGYLYPPQEGAEILIQYRPSDGDWSTIHATYTGADGGFSFVWSPPTAGTCYFKGIWEGSMSALSCESEPLKLEVEEDISPDPTQLYILIGATGVVSISAVGYAIYQWRLPKLTRAQKVSEKLDKKLRKRNYNGIFEDFDKLIEYIEEAISLGELQSEINEPPYSIAENLKSVKETLSKGFTEENIPEILKKSEIGLYIRGIKCILKVLQKPEDVKEYEKEDSNVDYFVTLISEDSKVFDKVNRVFEDADKHIFQDFWFSWENVEMEPIRLCFKNGKIDKARGRWHWKHIDINKPYLDEKGRIEVFLVPHFHTPLIRRIKEDVLFLVFAKCYGGRVHEYKVVHNEEIPEEYTEEGLKKSHWPETPYSGWYTEPPCK